MTSHITGNHGPNPWCHRGCRFVMAIESGEREAKSEESGRAEAIHHKSARSVTSWILSMITRDVWRHTHRMIFIQKLAWYIMGNPCDIIQLTKLGTVNTPNRTALFGDHANKSFLPSEPPFTPPWPPWAAKKSICTKKRILRESGINLEYLIMNQHVLTSPIEKSRTFWSRNDARRR